MASKVAAVLVICIVFAATMGVEGAESSGGAYKDCFVDCHNSCQGDGFGNTFCEMKCDSECMAKETADKLQNLAAKAAAPSP